MSPPRPALLASALLAAAVLLGPARAAADGEILIRGNYWRDRNTRVLAPEATLRKEVARTGTTVEAGYLLDAITSASAAAGVGADEPFTELRNEASVRLSQRIGPVSLAGQYRYSTESDYWAHTGGVTVGAELLQKNLTLAASYLYGHADVGMRRGTLGVIPVGTLDSHFLLVGGSQVLNRWMLLEAGYELSLLSGYQGNPYRMVRLFVDPADTAPLTTGTPSYEAVPRDRKRHAFSVGLRLTPVYRRGVLRHLGLYAKYRFYFDSWGVRAHTPELRAWAAVGPLELRLTGRYHFQSQADFYREVAGVAAYTGDGVDDGLHRGGCDSNCLTGDAKLSRFSAFFLEARLQLGLRFLDRPGVPLGPWLGGSLIAVSFGRYWNTGFANVTWGDAYVGGLELAFPL